LIAIEQDTPDTSLVEATAKKKGWKIVRVHDGEEALRMLQVRNWDAVLLDECLPLLSPMQCVGRFREWEDMNRVNRQRNIVLWSSGCCSIVPCANQTVQLPQGFDSALGKPSRDVDIEYIMARGERIESDFGVRDIIAR
jgi:hypothetical protein